MMPKPLACTHIFHVPFIRKFQKALTRQRHFGANTSPKRKRVNHLCQIPSLALRARISRLFISKWRCPAKMLKIRIIYSALPLALVLSLFAWAANSIASCYQGCRTFRMAFANVDPPNLSFGTWCLKFDDYDRGGWIYEIYAPEGINGNGQSDICDVYEPSDCVATNCTNYNPTKALVQAYKTPKGSMHVTRYYCEPDYGE